MANYQLDLTKPVLTDVTSVITELQGMAEEKNAVLSRMSRMSGVYKYTGFKFVTANRQTQFAIHNYTTHLHMTLFQI